MSGGRCLCNFLSDCRWDKAVEEYKKNERRSLSSRLIKMDVEKIKK